LIHLPLNNPNQTTHTMKKLVIYSAIAAGALIAPLHTSLAQAVEKTVAFKTSEGKYISVAPNSALDLGATKVGSRQVFTLVDTNGGDLADGDAVKVIQTDAVKDDPAAKGWKVAKDGTVARGASPATFKLKKVADKWAFQTPDGKFVGATASGGLGTVDTAETALQIEVLEAAPKEKKSAPAPVASPAVE
jgi:uncharacterized Zn ribbon protein